MKVLLCGLGAIGSIYADKISKFANVDFRVLVDKKRLEKYKKNPTHFNNKFLDLKYILPEEKFLADIIIIATKNDALLDVIANLKNFVGKNTIILSLLNGVGSENLIAERYGEEKVLLSYYIGHSAIREGRNIVHDGINKIVFGSKYDNDDNVIKVKNFFDIVGINYSIPEDIVSSLWFKFMVNVSLNQTTALYKLSVGEMKENDDAVMFFNNLLNEVEQIAIAEQVKFPFDVKNNVLDFVYSMPYESKTSMLQDVLASRKTEVEIFAGKVIELGIKHNIDTPYNVIAFNKLS